MSRGKKTGGRIKGTPNKDSADLKALLAANYPNWDPVIAMAEIAHTTRDESIRLAALKEVSQYIHPKRKAIEHSGPNNEPLIVKLEDAL